MPRAVILLAATLVSLAACAPTVKKAARTAGSAASDQAVEELTEPETRRELATMLEDPRVSRAVGEISKDVTEIVLSNLATEESQDRLASVTDRMVRTSVVALADGLRRELGPALRESIAEDVGPGLATALEAPELRAALGDTARVMAAHAVSGASGEIESRLSGASETAFADAASTIGTLRSALVALAVVVGLCVLGLLLGAVIAISRTRRTRAQTERLEAAVTMLVDTLRETHGHPDPQVLDVMRQAIASTNYGPHPRIQA